MCGCNLPVTPRSRLTIITKNTSKVTTANLYSTLKAKMIDEATAAIIGVTIRITTPTNSKIEERSLENILKSNSSLCPVLSIGYSMFSDKPSIKREMLTIEPAIKILYRILFRSISLTFK